MQSSTALRSQITALEARLAQTEEGIQALRALKDVAPLDIRETDRLRTLRANRTEFEDELRDAKEALQRAIAFEASPEAAERRKEAGEALAHVHDVAVAYREAASTEDAAWLALANAVEARLRVNASLREATGAACRLLPGGPGARDNDRLLMAVSGLTHPAGGGIGEAVAFFVMNVLRGAEVDQLVQVSGVQFDRDARLSVEAGVVSSTSTLLRRLEEVFTAAGFVVPHRVVADV